MRYKNKGFLFFIKIVAFTVACSIFVWFFVMPQYSMLNNASLIDKVNRIESIEGPKLVLIGNSNLIYGIDSELLEESIGMPVVNMGLHAGLGNEFHERMARFNVTEGDIYVLCHTSFDSTYDGKTGLADAVLAWVTVENHTKLWKCIHPRWAFQMAKGFPTYLKKILKLYVSGEGNKDDSIYSRAQFNKYGDYTLYRENGVYYPDHEIKASGVEDKTVNRLNALNEYLTDRGATLLLGGFPIPYGEFTDDKSEYESLQNELELALDFPVISNFEDYMYPYDLFYDTTEHLTTEGAFIRTTQLIEDINLWKESIY